MGLDSAATGSHARDLAKAEAVDVVDDAPIALVAGREEAVEGDEDLGGNARARVPPKILVAFHRLLPTCNKCNWRVVDYVDRLGLGKVPGMAARRRAVKAHTDACAKMAGV